MANPTHIEAFSNPLLAFVVPNADGQPGEPMFVSTVDRRTAVDWLRAAADQIEADGVS